MYQRLLWTLSDWVINLLFLIYKYHKTGKTVLFGFFHWSIKGANHSTNILQYFGSNLMLHFSRNYKLYRWYTIEYSCFSILQLFIVHVCLCIHLCIFSCKISWYLHKVDHIFIWLYICMCMFMLSPLSKSFAITFAAAWFSNQSIFGI